MKAQAFPAERAVGDDVSRPAQVKSASRALDIIEILASADTGFGFSDLARRLAIPKSSLHALLGVLTERGYVEVDPDRHTYALGIRAWEMGQAYLATRDLVERAMPFMELVVREINETVQLAVLDGIENVYLAKVDCSHPVRLQSEVGRRLHAHATGLGKVLLADLPEPVLHARFAGVELPRFNARTIQDTTHLFAVLDTVRQRGYAIDDQEYTDGLRCVAVPIHGADGRAVAALSASIPLTRADPGDMSDALRHIARASIDIAAAIGATTPDPRVASLTAWRDDDFMTGFDGQEGRLVTSTRGNG